VFAPELTFTEKNFISKHQLLAKGRNRSSGPNLQKTPCKEDVVVPSDRLLGTVKEVQANTKSRRTDGEEKKALGEKDTRPWGGFVRGYQREKDGVREGIRSVEMYRGPPR